MCKRLSIWPSCWWTFPTQSGASCFAIPRLIRPQASRDQRFLGSTFGITSMLSEKLRLVSKVVAVGRWTYVSVLLLVCPSVCAFCCLSIHLSICLAVCLCVCQSVSSLPLPRSVCVSLSLSACLCIVQNELLSGLKYRNFASVKKTSYIEPLTLEQSTISNSQP